MSISKLEHWEVGWNEGRRARSRRFGEELDARAFAGQLYDDGRRRTRVQRLDQWQVRWREGGRGSRAHKRTFERKRDAERFEREVKRRKELGELALWEQRNRSIHELAREWWAKYAVPNLAELTLDGYEPILAKHVVPRLGDYRVGEVTPEVVADFRAQLESAGVGRHAVRVSMVVLQAMFKQAIRWRWIESNPVKAVEKPSGKRERAVVCLAPAQVEAIRTWLIERDKLYAATIVSLVAYQGLRIPEEVLALEVRHVRANTLLIEQRNIKGRIVPGQKVRHYHPRSPTLLDPVRRDVTEYLMATGIRDGLLFPRRDGEPWKVHDYKNWTRRVWKKAREGAGVEPLPPYDLRHAYASLRIRGGASIPELAEELGHSPQMTVGTYTHVIRELQGLPMMSAEEQIELARSDAPWAAAASGA
jgi:integrase